MNTVRLSFCIPTYNFADFLPATLDSIIAQADEQTEIVIVDGGSEDATDSIVRSYMQRFERIVYFRREQRVGVDADILKSVEIASGDYCWLFSSDDVLRANAIERVRGLIDGTWNVGVMGFNLCDRDMRVKGQHPILGGIDRPAVFDMNVPGERADYLALVETTTALFSFISSIVVRRDDWLAGRVEPDLVGSYWIICAKICAMMSDGVRICYVPDAVFDKRDDNDSFLARGIVWRTRLAVEGFPAIAERFFGPGSPEHRAFQNAIRKEFPLAVMAALTLAAFEREGRAGATELRRLAARAWSEAGIRGRIDRVMLGCAPIWALRAMRWWFGRPR